MKSCIGHHIAIFLVLTVFLGKQPCLAQTMPVNNYLTNASELFEKDERDLDRMMPSLIKHFEKLTKLEARKNSREKLLHSIFYQAVNRFFKSYDPSATFSDMILKGNYGCVPGTALLTMTLEYFNFDYSIIELTDHVYLEVRSNGKNYVLESTDLANGFIENGESIQKLREHSLGNSRNSNSLSSVGAEEEQRNSSFIRADLTLEQLAGLQYYNQSIYNYYKKDLVNSLEMITLARNMYDSERTEKMMQFVISTILRSKKISSEAKKKYLNQYVKQVQNKRLSQTL